ncbi:MAG: family 10 glycosylhydrolase [Armatimonadetes bacterium]|nr:family 10 glycosylhydrolase [Armatimonadota bacterium]
MSITKSPTGVAALLSTLLIGTCAIGLAGASGSQPGQSTANARGSSAQRDGNAVYLRDFSQIVPAGAYSTSPGPGQWLLRDWKGQGVLAAGGAEQLPQLTYPVHRKGWYDISIGLYTYGEPMDDAEWRGLHLKLTSDAWYTHFYGGKTGLGYGWELGSVDEFFWKRADLTNEDIQIYQPYGRFFKPTGGISYIKLIPLTDPQVAADRRRYATKLQRAPRKHVGGMADFWSWVMVTRKIEPAGTEEVLDNHQNAGFDTIFFQINADAQVHYHSRVAQWVDQGANQDPRTEMGQAASDILRNHDPLKVASERARKIGLRFFAWFRMTNEQSVDNDRLEYMRRFRSMRIRGSDNQPTRWPSLAYPEVCSYKLAILKEVITNYPCVDGLLLDFLRTMPVTGYDPPVIGAYVRVYGVNPLEDVKERSSPRWKQFRADVITRFVRDVRKVARDEEKRSGRKIQIAARVTPRDNLWKGLDVERWVREGLIDIVIPCNYSMFNPPFRIEPFVRMARATRCKVYAGINPFFAGGDDDAEHHPNRNEQEVAEIIYKRVTQGCPTQREYTQRVLDYYAEGVDGVVIYESEVLTSPTRLYPARAGMLPMFRTFAQPREALSYLKQLPPD